MILVHALARDPYTAAAATVSHTEETPIGLCLGHFQNYHPCYMTMEHPRPPPQRTVRMLQTVDRDPNQLPFTTTATARKIMAMPLTPENAQTKLTPVVSQLSAFSSPRRSSKKESSPTTSLDEQNFFSRVTENPSSGSTSSSPPQQFFLPRHSSSPREQSSMYLSPATTPPKSEATSPSIMLSDLNENAYQPAAVAAAAVLPTFPTSPSFAAHPLQPKVSTALFFAAPQPVHLFEQQQAQLLLQQEQELLQRQLHHREEFHNQHYYHAKQMWYQQERQQQQLQQDYFQSEQQALMEQQEKDLLQRQMQHDFREHLFYKHIRPQQRPLPMERPLMEQPRMEHPLMEHPLMDHPLMEHPLMEHPLMEHQMMEHQMMEYHLMEHQTMEHQMMEQLQLRHGGQMHVQPRPRPQPQPSPPRNYQPGEPTAEIQRLQVDRMTEMQHLPLHHEPLQIPIQRHGERVKGQSVPFPQPFLKPNVEQAPHQPISPQPNADTPPEFSQAPAVQEVLYAEGNWKPNWKPIGEANGDWPSEAVEAVSSTMNRALRKLKSLATQMAKTTSERVPEAVNTSTESSSSSTDHETSSGFDLKELEEELRNMKSPEAESKVEEKTDDPNSDEKRQHRRNNGSSGSFDTLGAQKPATLVQGAVPPRRNLQKPVPLPPGAMPPRRPVSAQKIEEKVGFPNEEGTGSANAAVPSVNPLPPAARSISSNVARAVTPIMRMRNHGVEQEAARIADSKAIVGAAAEVKRTLSDKGYKAMKQKKWKEKIKFARKQRDEEKSKRNRDYSDKRESRSKPRRRKKSRVKTQKSRHDDSSYSMGGRQFRLPAVVPSCRNDISEMLEKFLRTRCGDLNDTFFEDDDNSVGSMEGSEPDSDEDETAFDSVSSVGHTRASVAADATTRASVATDATTSATNTTTDHETSVAEETAPSKIKSDESSNIGVNDKKFIRDFIATATTKGILLIIHKMNPKKALSQPTKSIGFIQRGVPVESGRFTGPKFFWMAVEDSSEIGIVDLFDIRSLEKATALELENYPLAMPGRSLFLRMNKGIDYVFEARNEDEALRFVHGMRWVIARLSFNLIIGNVSICCELLEVDRTGKSDDFNGKFPSSVEEEAQWNMAMNDVTSHLINKTTTPLH